MRKLRRALALVGLIATGAIAYLLVTGQMSAADAGLRAGAVMGAVLLAGRLSDAVISGVARSLERTPVPNPGRRASDG